MDNIVQILLNVDRSMPDNLFASAIVGAPYGVTVFMNVLTKLSPHAKRLALFTSSLEEARERIFARYHELQAGSLLITFQKNKVFHVQSIQSRRRTV